MIYLISDDIIREYLPHLSNTERNEINASMTRIIHEYCNTTFEAVNREDRYDSRAEIIPEHRPIISVLGLVDDGTSLVEDRDFFVYQSKIFIEAPSGRRKALRLTYKSGFEEVPQTVREVALELFRYKVFTAQEGSLLFYKSQRIEERVYEKDLNLDEESILSRLSPWVQPIARELRKGDGPLRVGVI